MTNNGTLMGELRKLNIALRRLMSASEGGKRAPTVADMALHYVYMSGGSAKQKDIEQEFCVRRSTASQLIKKLEADGCVTSSVTGGDGRSKTVYLTESAKKKQSELACKIQEAAALIEGALTQSEFAEFMLLAEKIRYRADEIANSVNKD